MFVYSYMVTSHFSKTIHSGLYASLSQQGMLWSSCHTLAYCYKHNSEKLHSAVYLQRCCQDSDAAQKALFDMTIQAGLQSGLVAGGIMQLL